MGRRQSDRVENSPPHVLVIEPHDDTRLLYGMLLTDMGWIAYAVSDGEAAMGVAEHRLPDVIVTEIAVPSSMASRTRRLSANPSTRHIPVIAARGPAFPGACSGTRSRVCGGPREADRTGHSAPNHQKCRRGNPT
jgi:CheY-like chemotaxis protein